MIKEVSTQNRKAKIEHSEIGYSVSLYIDNRVYQKSTVQSIHEAEEIVENFIDSDNTPTLLNE